MQQHPIPQNVTQYRFKLIGFMDLKQFAIFGGGLLSAFIISKITILPGIIRMPIAGLIAGAGAAMAFLPYEERTLDVWFINFIKSINSPTQYIWRAAGILPDFFNYQRLRAGIAINNQAQAIKNYKQYNNYLSSLRQTSSSKEDVLEKEELQKINNLLNPSATINSNLNNMNKANTTTPINNNQAYVSPVVLTPAQAQAMPNTTPNIGQLITGAPPINVPLKVKSLKLDTRPFVPKKKIPQYVSEIEMSIVPEEPNIITGMTVGSNDELISNVIIEVVDQNKLPIRTVKSNNLGQFFMSIPLENGKYSIIAEHNDHTFDTINIELVGDIVPPIKLISKPS